MSAREVLAAAYDASLFRPHHTNMQAADDLIDVLAAAGYSVVPEGHARIDGKVVRLVEHGYRDVYIGSLWHRFEMTFEPNSRRVFSIKRPLDSEEAPDE